MGKIVPSVVFLALFALASCVSSPAPAPAPTPKPVSSARIRAEELVAGEMGVPRSTPRPPSSTSATSSGAASSTDTSSSSGASSSQPITTTSEVEEIVDEMTAAEKRFFENYLKRLKYMVVIKEGSSLSEFQSRSVAAKANEYLLKQGYDVVQYDQLQKIMADQTLAWEAEAGQTMSLIQYIAQTLGADVYVELDAVPSTSTTNGRYYGEASFAVSMFDPSTAELIGSVTYKSDRSVSLTSMDEAALNAMVASTAQFMPRVVQNSVGVLRNKYSNGISYQLVLQKTPDSRAVSMFRRNLMSRVREVRMGPSSADQTTMDVFMFGSLVDLEDACYAAFDRTPGMENSYMLYTRGKTITFNSGN